MWRFMKSKTTKKQHMDGGVFSSLPVDTDHHSGFFVTHITSFEF